jgi:hypothetical protein
VDSIERKKIIRVEIKIENPQYQTNQLTKQTKEQERTNKLTNKTKQNKTIEFQS